MNTMRFKAWDKLLHIMYDVDSMSWHDGVLYGVWVKRPNDNSPKFLETDDIELLPYIGYKDSECNEIIEGDILQGDYYPFLSEGDHDYLLEIQWDDRLGAFIGITRKARGSLVRGISNGMADYLESFHLDHMRIIGNIVSDGSRLFDSDGDTHDEDEISV